MIENLVLLCSSLLMIGVERAQMALLLQYFTILEPSVDL